jgi:foldase protein PrsA
MKKTKRVMSFLLIGVLALGMAFTTACSKKANPTSSLVVTVGDKKVFLDEMMYYIYAVEAEGNYYDQMWQQYYGMSYWDAEYSEGITMRDQTKQYLIDTVVMYEILYDKAIEAGYTLTDEEKNEAATNADTIMSSITTEQIKVTGFNKSILTKVQEKLIIGEKYYNEIIEGLNLNKDEITATVNKADYKEYSTEYLFVPTSSYDATQQLVPLSDEEKAAAKVTITDALDKVKAGEEFAAIAKENETIETDGISFIKGDKNVETEYQDAAVKLANGEYTNSIVETEYGYYIIKMIDTEATTQYEEAVAKALSTAEQEGFDAAYNTLKEDYPFTVNAKIWDTIVLGNTTTAVAPTTKATATPAPTEAAK